MLRICKTCNEEKELEKFVNQDGKYRFKCKECKNKARRTGRVSQTRFKLGGHPGKEFQKGLVPWYKIKNVSHPSKGKGVSLSKDSIKTKNWCKKVKERDGNKCLKCGSTFMLAAHHIIPWKENESLRFDISNGMSLCCSCHAKEEGLGIKIKPK